MKLSDVINTQVDSRNRAILYEVCGIDTGKQLSMRSVGQRHGLTAERVRQIMMQIRDRLVLAGKQEELALVKFCQLSGSPELPVLIDNEANQIASEIFGEPITLGGLNNLLQAMGRETGHRVILIGNGAALASEAAGAIAPLWRKVSVAAKRIARSRGAVCVYDIIESVASEGQGLSIPLVEIYLSVIPWRGSIVVDGVRWYVFDETPNMVRRAISFCQAAGPLRIERKNSVLFPPSLVDNNAPLDVICFVLESYGFSVNNGWAHMTSGSSVSNEPQDSKGLSVIQEKMIQVLGDAGPMARDDFLNECEKSGVNRVTATIYLYRGYFVNENGIVSLPSHSLA